MADRDVATNEEGKERPAGAPTWMNIAFVAATLGALAVPLVGMPFVHADPSAEKRELAEKPALMQDGSFNTAYLEQAGSYFEDRFAFRTQLVDLDATLKERLFGTSATSNVVVGTDGWLYYAGTLDDYQRVNQMSDQSLTNAAINLSLMQEYVQSLGKSFTFTVCPNKNSLYPEHMPYYLPQGPGESNLERIEPLLDAYGINYVDMGEVMLAQDDVVYYERDSHWNGAGALAGYNALLDAISRPHETYADVAPTMDDEHVGDVEGMLHPSTATVEQGPRWADAERFVYTNDTSSVEDSFIITTSEDPQAHDIVMVYRDSFGNALIPYLATAYHTGVFTKRIPYDMSEQALKGVRDVMVERVERHLSFFATQPPYMPAPERTVEELSAAAETATTLTASTNGPYLVLEGDIDPEYAEQDSRYYVRLSFADGSMHTYEAFHVSPLEQESQDSEGAEDALAASVRTEQGYRAYVTGASGAQHATVIVKTGDDFVPVYEGELSLDE